MVLTRAPSPYTASVKPERSALTCRASRTTLKSTRRSRTSESYISSESPELTLWHVSSRLQFYTILTSCADVIQAVSVDEALVEVTSRVQAHRPEEDEDDGDGFDRAKEVAELVRNEVRAATGCESEQISLGVCSSDK